MICGIVLAGGTSSRLGQPKQLLTLEGRPVLQHVVDAAAAGGLDETVVVLGHRAEEVKAALRLPAAARTAVNPDFAAGQSTSLRVGLASAGSEAQAAVVLLGDQPGISPEAIRAVIDAYIRTGGRVVRAWYGARPGHPVLLDRTVWQEVGAEEGDRGARDLLARHPDWEVRVELGGAPPPDLDTWEDYKRLAGSSQPPDES